VAPAPDSIATGKRAYNANCAACHGSLAQGAVKSGLTISILEEQKGRQPPDLTDGQWDHGSTDGEIFTVIKRGLPPTMMAGFDGRTRTRTSGTSSTTFAPSRRNGREFVAELHSRLSEMPSLRPQSSGANSIKTRSILT
jgi:hypothetical protein